MWKLIYNFLIFPYILIFFLIGSIFVKKIRKGFFGRLASIKKIRTFSSNLDEKDLVYWFHASSHGEFEQIKPVLDGIKKATSEFLLIMDSEGQCDPKDIKSFWNKRNESDLVCGYRSPRYDYAYRKFISKIFYFIYNILFKVPLRDPSFAFVFMNKKTYTNLNNFTPYLPDGFFWEFNARANKLNFLFSEIKINHRKRSSGDTKIYTFGKLPKVAYNNLTGLIKLKKEIG